MKTGYSFIKGLARFVCAVSLYAAAFSNAANAANVEAELWDLANKQKQVHQYSTLFTAHNVREYLSSESGIEEAIEWCKNTGVTKVYLETFRSDYTAREADLKRAKQMFLDAGFEVSGCVTTTYVGKQSTGWELISCYTDTKTQDRLEEVFRYTASMFDEIMIDDFWFTDCACAECEKARKAGVVTIDGAEYPVSGDTWEDYRCELMYRLSKEKVIGPAKKVNPDAKLIIKYPQWYDNFHNRGYEVARETELFDKIWVGTETRDYDDPRWGGKVQYEAYFIMRWLLGIGGDKCAGGWFDYLGTTEHTYIEQARQTVLGGARESMLFCFGGLQGSTGPRNIEALRKNIPELLEVASEVRSRKLLGIPAYKPINSHPDGESYVFDFVGMLGLPLVPCHELPEDAKAAFFSVHSLKDPALERKLASMIDAGNPILITGGLAARLEGEPDLEAENVRLLKVNGEPKSLLDLKRPELDALRSEMLEPFDVEFSAPNKVGLYLYTDGSWVIENFNDTPVEVVLNGTTHELDARSWKYDWK
ncbi:MAG: hypothetical protein K9N48_03310 [Verrucomicrobia bacterium]|nr:hypothetical protein [Verrucomicrobiota bacterium]MCF7708173.1 hypothetical protein [Verrucomicrobiota bacterium]